MDLMGKAFLAQQAARTAGELIWRRRDLHVQNKGEKDYVTEMDVKSEKLIRDMLLSACPEDVFFGEEEGGSVEGKGRWIVDPINGTANYIRGIVYYAISIAYELDGELVLGCVYCPEMDEMYLGIKGKGATLNGKLIQMQPVDKLSDAILGMSFAHRDPEKSRRTLAVLPRVVRQVNDLRRLGSVAYDLCCVASGKYDGFFEMGLYIYEIAAGIVIVREAGGKVGGWDPKEDVLRTGNIIAGEKTVFDFLRRELNPVPGEE